MHSVTESANGSRGRRIAETAAALRTAARRLTAAHGLNGFTIDQLCADVGVSRRTFFNYFASKENAVLGLTLRAHLEELDERFVHGDGDLLDDYLHLHAARWALMGHTRTEAEEVGRLLADEPRLHAQLMSIMADAEVNDIALVRSRPDAPTDPLVVDMLVRMINPLLRSAIAAFFDEEHPDFLTLLRRRADAGRAALSPTSPKE
ncbi:hypothetical protein MhomT_09500 [Microbacterium hominis]|nr:hypothetical protein MhomT_09500 [Microbacterium hominis]